MTRWAAWSTPRRAGALMIGVELLAVLGVVMTAFSGQGPTTHDLVVLGVLAVAGTACAELAVVRRRGSDARVADLPDAISAWTLAGALLLPVELAVVLVIVLRTHLGWRTGSRPSRPTHREVFDVAAAALACAAVAWALDGSGAGTPAGPFGGGLPVILVATLAYAVVESAPSVAVALVSDPGSELRDAVGDVDDLLFYCATLTMGVLAAAAVLVEPWLVALVLPPLVVVLRMMAAHRTPVPVDAATGLPVGAAWQAAAERATRRIASSGATVGVVAIELVGWRTVERQRGRDVLDHVMAAVADALRDVLRSRASGPALIGVLGRGRFAVFLPMDQQPAGSGLLATAARLRDRVAGLRIQVPTPDGPLTLSGFDAVVGTASGSGPDVALPALLRTAGVGAPRTQHRGSSVG